jgi:hypothetical protein
MGGAVFNEAGAIVITNSTFTGNTANGGAGGTVPSGNSGSAGKGLGGGLFNHNGTVTVTNSTFSGNTAAQGGRGIFNLSDGAGKTGTANINNSILGQSGATTITDFVSFNNGGNAPVNSGVKNLMSNRGTFPVAGVIAATNPLLGALASHGGPTQTMALQSGSPAIDAGDAAAVAGVGTVPLYDQRGNPFTRVFDGDNAGGARIDVGAFESIPEDAVHALFGDYNRNGSVDAADYILWRKTLGLSGLAAFSGADGDGNGVIGQGDYAVWRAHFGQMLPGAAAGASNAARLELTVAPIGEAASSATSEVAMAVPTTAKVVSDTEPSLAKPGVGSELVWFADAEGSPRARARQDAVTTWGRADALPHDSGLLAWLSSPRFNKLPEAEDIGSSRHSSEDVTQDDGSEANSVDEIFAGLASARFFDF